MNLQAHTDASTVLGEGHLQRAVRESGRGEAFRWGWRIASFTVLLGASLLAISMIGWITGVRTQNDRLRSEVDSLAIERSGLHEKAGFLEAMRDMLIGKVEIAEEGRAAAEGMVKTLSEEKASLGEKIEKLTGAVDILMEKLTSSKVRIASLEQATRAKDDRISELETTRDSLLVANFDLKHEVAAAREQVSDLSEQNQALTDELAQLSEREAALMAELGRVSDENVAVSSENYQLQKRLAELSYELESKEAAVAALQDHLAHLEFEAEIAVAAEPVIPVVPVPGESSNRFDDATRVLD